MYVVIGVIFLFVANACNKKTSRRAIFFFGVSRVNPLHETRVTRLHNFFVHTFTAKKN